MIDLTLADPAFLGAAAGPSLLDDYVDLVMADSPLGFWPLQDTSGASAAELVAGRTMTFRNSPTLAVPGPGGLRGVRFNGSTQASDTADQAVFQRGAWTAWSIECWLRFTTVGTSAQAPLVWRGTGGSATDEIIMVAVNNGVSGRIQANASNVALNGRVHVNSDGGWNDGYWHHVAITAVAAGAMTLYVDGVSRGSNSAGRPTTATAGPRVAAGANIFSATTFGQYFGGDVALAAIYGTTLSAARVAARYSALTAA